MILFLFLFLACGGSTDKDSSLSILCTPTTIVVDSSPIFHWDRGCRSNEVLCLDATYWDDIYFHCGRDNGVSIFAFSDGRCFLWGGTCGEGAPQGQDPTLLTHTDGKEAYDACYAFFGAYLNGKKDTYPECE